MKRNLSKFFNWFLVLFMVVSMINPVHVHAADYSLAIEKTEFEWGEAIMVDANAGNWIGLYDVGATPGEALSYYYVYVNAGTPQNILEGDGNASMVLSPGTYELMLFQDGGYTVVDKKTITIKTVVDDSTSLVTDKVVYQYGESVKITAKNETPNAWVGVYDGIQNETTDYSTQLMAALHHGRWYYTANYVDVTYDLPVGDYTVVLFKDGGYIVDKLVNISVKGTKLISTDKKSYYWGEEPINITVVEREGASSTDWVAMFNVLETPAPNMYRYWAYANTVYGTNSLTEKYTPYVTMEKEATIYTIYLLASDGYDVIDYTTFTIQPGIVSVDEEQAPTCENDGWQKVTLTNGKTSTIGVSRNPELKAIGHSYSEKWSYDGVEKQTHSKTCTNECECETRTLTEPCTFGEGVVTDEATTEKDGEMTYTCTVCEGTYTQVISKKEVDHIDTKAATCEKPGLETTYYTDGTHSEKLLPAEGHKYPTTWTYDEKTGTHSKTCTNECECEARTLTETCKFTSSLVSGNLVYTCSSCEGAYSEPAITTDKKEYNFGEDIIVDLNYLQDDSSYSWVGLYRKGEVPGAEGVGSTYWNWSCYVGGENSLTEAYKFDNAELYGCTYTHGDWVLYLFDNNQSDSYVVLATYEFTIKPVVDTEVRHEPTCEKDGWIDVVYTDGLTGTITAETDETLKALGHAYPEKWSYDGVEHQTHSKTCTNECECEKRTLIEDCTFGEGVVTDEATAEKDGEMTYTCTVCEGTYTEVISKKEIDHVDTVAATCEKTGVETTYYTDGTHSEKVLPAKGHKYSETWTFDGEYYNTHSKTCANECECEKRTLTEECDLSYEMIGGELYQTCETCEGSYAVTVLTTNKTEYDSSEEIIINAEAITSASWVGIYDRKLTTSTNYNNNPFAKHQGRWYDVDGNEEVTYKLTPGDYTVVLFEDGGYKAVQCVQIKVTGTKLITTDKAEYFLGEDIKVSVNYEPKYDKDWVGMYNLINTPGDGSQSHYYAYIKDMTETSSIYTDFVEQKAIDSGSFTFYILENDGYTFVDYTTVVVWPAIVSVDEEQVPTCETDGWKKVTLADGSKKTITADLDPTLKAFGGHTYSDKWIYDGEDVKTHSKSCTTCTETCGCENAKLTEECTFDAGAVTEEPALDKPGLMTYSCEVCEGTYTKEIPALTVTNTEVILEAGCEDEGTLRTYYSDGTYKDTVIDALGHDMGYFIVTTEPTCTEFGEATSECSRCDHTEKDVVDKLEHSYVANVTDPTCTEGGYTTYVCDECGDSYKAEETVKLGHTYVATVTEPTCTKDGYTTYVCDDCGDSYTADETEKLDHTYVATVTEPTCHSKGYTTYTCDCGESYTADEKDMLWHTFTNYVYNNDATTEKNGTETAKCENCTATNTREVEGTKLPTTPEPTLPTLTDVTRVAGADRYDTAFKVADTLKATLGVDKFDAVIVANGTNFADALAGSYLSSKQNAPILMTDKKDANIQKLVDYIKTNLKADGIVFILGGTAAVSDKVEKQLNGFAIERLAGNDRYETNLAILRRAGGVGYNDLLVCTGTNFADSLSASATGQPMLLVGKKLTGRQKVFFSETLPETNVVIVGGEGAVNKAVEKELKKEYENVSRLAGASRYETSVMVADKYFEEPSYAVVALATNFPDGLSGGALAYALKSPLLLTNGQKANFNITAKYTNSQNITAGYVLGGNKLVTDEAKDAIFKK